MAFEGQNQIRKSLNIESTCTGFNFSVCKEEEHRGLFWSQSFQNAVNKTSVKEQLVSTTMCQMNHGIF